MPSAPSDEGRPLITKERKATGVRGCSTAGANEVGTGSHATIQRSSTWSDGLRSWSARGKSGEEGDHRPPERRCASPRRLARGPLSRYGAGRRRGDRARAAPYRSTDLDGCFLVIAANGPTWANGEPVFADAERRGMLCNVVDVPKLYNFILPSIMRQGDLAIAVSTAGASPALARKIRLELEDRYRNEYGEALELLGSLRAELGARPRPHDQDPVPVSSIRDSWT